MFEKFLDTLHERIDGTDTSRFKNLLVAIKDAIDTTHSRMYELKKHIAQFLDDEDGDTLDISLLNQEVKNSNPKHLSTIRTHIKNMQRMQQKTHASIKVSIDTFKREAFSGKLDTIRTDISKLLHYAKTHHTGAYDKSERERDQYVAHFSLNVLSPLHKFPQVTDSCVKKLVRDVAPKISAYVIQRKGFHDTIRHYCLS